MIWDTQCLVPIYGAGHSYPQEPVMRNYPLAGVFMVLFLYGALFVASPTVNRFLHDVEVALAIEGDVITGTGTTADASILLM